MAIAPSTASMRAMAKRIPNHQLLLFFLSERVLRANARVFVVISALRRVYYALEKKGRLLD
jgi:hypothetical protein